MRQSSHSSTASKSGALEIRSRNFAALIFCTCTWDARAVPEEYSDGNWMVAQEPVLLSLTA